MKKVDDLVSIIMPVYNAEQWIDRSVNSLLSQTHTHMEIILVDDGSTDSSAQRCAAYAAVDSRVNFIGQEHGGASRARNRGIDVARGSFVAFADTDDYLSPDCIERLLAPPIKDEKIDISVCISDMEMPDGTIRLYRPNIGTEGYITSPLEEMCLGKKFNHTLWGKLYRRRLLRGFRCHENMLNGEDLADNWELFGAARKVWYQPYVGYHYLYRHGSLSHASEAVSEIPLACYFLEKVLRLPTLDNGSLSKITRQVFWTVAVNCLRGMFAEDAQSEKISKHSNVLLPGLQMVYDNLVAGLELKCVPVYGRLLAGFFPSQANYIFGAGRIATGLAKVLNERNFRFDGFCVSDSEQLSASPDNLHDVISFRDTKMEDVALVVAVKYRLLREIMEAIAQGGIKKVYVW